jgi:hypothetical protein
MLNKPFRNNGFVVSVGNGLGTSLFPCPVAGIWLRDGAVASGVNWSGCGNYGYSDTSIANYNYFTDGSCGEYAELNGTWSRPAGDVLYDNGCCQVIWDGSSYYVEDNCNPCGESGTLTGQTRHVNVNQIYWDGCGTNGYFDYSYELEEEYHDGMCGTYWVPVGSYQAQHGDLIYSYNDCCYVYYDEYSYPYYYVNDNCGEPPPCPDAGTSTGNTITTNHQTLYWTGCGTDGYFTYAYNIEEEYHDGMCGTYWTWASSWVAETGYTIYSNECCSVSYQDFGNYYVEDNCGEPPPPCPDAGTLLRFEENTNQNFDWSGCGSSGNFVYQREGNYFFADGYCGEYSSPITIDEGYPNNIYDSGCCQVVYEGYGNWNVYDNCGGGGGGGDYPPAGTLLNSSSGDQTAEITWGELIGQTNYQTVTVGSYWSNEYADGSGGSYYEGSTDYFADGTNLFTEPYGLEVSLNWAVDVNGTTESGSFVWGNEIGNWTLQSGTPSRTSTSLVDIITDGYMIYESDSWWNGDANVKVQVIFQSGGGYITNTITF